ncbi:MAG: STAS domain-containing protein [Adhaeribacter sp.]
MELYHEIKAQAYVLILSGNLDEHNAGEIDNLLKKAIKSRKKNVLIDCRNLNYISSAGLGIFLSNLPELKEKEISLIFFGMKPGVRKVFSYLGLDAVLTIKDNLEEEQYDETLI